MNPAEMATHGYPAHVLQEDRPLDPNYVYTPNKATPSTKKVVIGMDCEMCLTAKGSEITRVTLVDFQGKTLYDELVKPENPIVDYLTTWSGMTAERLLHTKTTLETVQNALLRILDS